ncbi:MAG: UDP-N-acetylmuramoyl-tripeptide--D-alanyl-D-alanine ligase [Candidatus Gastranaerophilales bacterium]|nr:UDP-N-acetylmuramoyl-tripeptide--D-alanyl-D-alanine ligase [Candidatus Gastranaerophilales bacterium]
MQFGIREVIENTKGVLLKGDIESDNKFSISTDTRKIAKGDFYLPLRGENYDGHSFIDNAVAKGAIGYFTQDKTKINKNAGFIIYVDNCLVAYLRLSEYIRSKINPKVVAITGSSGKTTVKEMLFSVLSTTYKTHKTALNHNNEIGLCETLFSMPFDSKYLILEMGMRNLGEIELLSYYSKPDIGIITNVGSAHVELLGNKKNIACAKCEIASHLNKNGLFIAPFDKIICDTVKFEGEKIFTSNAQNIKVTRGSTSFTYKGKEFELSIEGEHNVQNAILVIEAALSANVPYENIKSGLKNFKPIEKRWEISEIKGYKFVNDSYNANPESMKAAIKTFLSVNEPPLLLVLGDMGELGKDSIAYHKEIGEFLSSYKDINFQLVTVGDVAKYILKASIFEGNSFKTTKECAQYILNSVPVGTTILLKASRFMKFEEIMEAVAKL